MNDYYAILDHIAPALLVVFRIGGLMLFGPVFGSPAIPVRVKVFLAFILGVALYPTIASVQGGGTPLRLELWSLVPLIGLELLIGLVVGFAAGLPMVAVQTGGLAMGQQMGLGFAKFYNPGIDDEADVLGQLLFFLALAGFLLIGGHESMILAVLRTFEYLPPGEAVFRMDAIDLIIGLLLAAFELALRIAAPVIAIIFLQSLAMGFMAKTVPQLNILSLGFLARILVGITVVMVGLVILNEVIMDGIDEALDMLMTWASSSPSSSSS